MQKSNILITSATGNVGTPLVQKLQEKDIPVTAATRNADKMQTKFSKTLETVHMDFSEPGSFIPALKHKDLVFLCGPSATPGADQLLLPLVSEAKNQGVKHIVFIASYPNVMEAIEQSGMDYTFIRANFFMQNFEMYQTHDIRDKDQIFLPVGKGKAPFIHARDIGEVAAEVIANPEPYKGETLYITGPESMDHFQAADIFSDVLGRTITFENPDDETYRKVMEERGKPKEYIDAMIAVFGKIKDGKVDKVSNTVEEILNRKPITLKEYMEEMKAHFTQ
ncbi:MAG: SDR family oxidoreductase [Bacteroidales bacterium]|nr:SDR family oxidoreductase [Bacteroidales bacterium]